MTDTTSDDIYERTLDERAEALARDPSKQDSGESHQTIVVVKVGNECLGIPSASLLNIVPLEPITPIPGVPDFFAGVATVYGELYPVLDTASFLGLKGTPHSRYLAVVEWQDRHVALLVDVVLDVRDISEEGLSTISGTSRFVSATTEDLVSLLDVERLLGTDALLVGKELAS